MSDRRPGTRAAAPSADARVTAASASSRATTTSADEPAAATARALVTALVAHGVRHVVLAPGSRSAPLAYALQEAERAGWLHLHVRVDERVAGFLALGLSRAAAAPVAVVTTSGTAVANLHPAVLEAAHSGLPLVVVSADRPHEMRGTGANQTTDQVGIFASAPRFAVDLPAGAVPGPALDQVVTRALAAARGLRTNDPGPVHLNVGLRDPLAPSSRWVPGPVPAARDVVAPAGPPAAEVLRPGPRTVVVAGDGAGPAARELAERAGWPLLAEPTSGSRSGTSAIGPYRLLLADPALGGAVERVVVLGHPTLSRPVSTLLARRDVEVVVVAPRGPWTDVAGVASRVVGAVAFSGQTETTWMERWRRAADAAEEVIGRALADGFDGLYVARAVAGAAVAGAAGSAGAGVSGAAGVSTLVVGSSNTVRDLDLVALPWRPGEAPHTVANRGLAGIDGTVATASGLALGTGRPVRAVMGDLTFLHDAGALARGRLEAEVDLQIVVLNDSGGGIFATLEHGAPDRAGEFERIFGTPQDVDLASLAAAYGARYGLARTPAELDDALRAPVRGRSVVEVPVDRRGLRERRAALAADVRHAVRSALV
ncbi:2-succinyl-5-enolpyruvyl-6-hydroxy-3-cyclohexene-1-carboxylic-acid synthase [Georgenia sp. EYE_87]|uniref:2-succinyl-5-enolpyruvyl-6-hydroxy-3- cyclohexene-1-carboxylic-acid synthase n=1 Tax=Georgenia sp. EYE_87 TaxID=2853448 RepID=UPI002006A1A0|nr:2-succinyl-5-enolpyruvyl-6-hydroxy-3-cyclohexene-1-carboxylic-acid synthase [Georgenia sp. EYE_87]MCK6209803.1 2-succinyl-5-enolpyruvyl-6-hydroxy-3-cyclohexene-1-carboxylic-acid synthase [Georgenia sp. EYE_87]